MFLFLLSWGRTFALLSGGLVFASPITELKHGRYAGWIEVSGREERLSAVAEFFLEAPDDLAHFPRLNATIRMNLGGIHSHEYISFNFKDLKYDFDLGNLTFDEHGKDLRLKTKVTIVSGRRAVIGDVYIRSLALNGKVVLLEETDEPIDGGGPHDPSIPQSKLPFSPALDGQYDGICDKRLATLQIQTVRGLANGKHARSYGLEGVYGISARLAFRGGPLCGSLPEGAWCTRYHFNDGAFNVYNGHLSLRGDAASEACQIQNGELTCRFRTFGKPMHCKLERRPDLGIPLAGQDESDERFFARQSRLRPSREQLAPLSNPKPPMHEALSQELGGEFWGHIHNETNDTYLPIKLDVVPYVASDNPHNLNQMMIAATATLSSGANEGSHKTHTFESRSFYLHPGFVLGSKSMDGFLAVSHWTAGFVRGVWHSHAYGRVGTVELVKGKNFPELRGNRTILSPIVGAFSGRSLIDAIEQWLQFVSPTSASHEEDHLVRFHGSFQSAVGNSPVRAVEAGALDPYTRHVGYALKRNDAMTFASGLLERTGDLKIFWAPTPQVGSITTDYVLTTYERQKGKK